MKKGLFMVGAFFGHAILCVYLVFVVSVGVVIATAVLCARCGMDIASSLQLYFAQLQREQDAKKGNLN